MKRVSTLVSVLVTLLLTASMVAPVAAQVEFACDDGSNVVISNGVEFSVNIRPGDYRATVIGLNGFDPVLAVVETATGANLCNDDAQGAARYAAELPSTGVVAPSGLNAQRDFSNTGSDFLDVTLLVGGLNGSSGEFILLFEGMQVTTNDGLGDPFIINGGQNVIDSGVGIHAYVIHVTPSLDPLLFVVDDNNDMVQTESGPVYCDDASNADLCWRLNPSDPAVSLEGYSLTDGAGTAVADPFDPYLFAPSEVLDPTIPYITYIVSSYKNEQNQQSTGEYVFAIHTGIGGPGGQTNAGQATPVPHSNSSSSGTTTVADAVAIDCDVTGAQIEGEVNTYLNVECPANCTRGSLWGTTIYTDDSAICTGAIHAGLIPASGGQLAVVIAEGQDSYEGTTANGITSSNWGSWTRSILLTPPIGEDGPVNQGNTGNTQNNSGAPSGEVRPIAYGDTLNAEIGSLAGDTWEFQASARDVVTIAVNADDFDPLVIVTDLNGRELSRDDDSGPGFNSLISNLRIPSDGRFLIVVTSFNGAIDVGTSYEISLTGG
jgi:hypothetical protein